MVEAEDKPAQIEAGKRSKTGKRLSRWAEGRVLGARVRQEANGNFNKPRGGKL